MLGKRSGHEQKLAGGAVLEDDEMIRITINQDYQTVELCPNCAASWQ